MKKTTYSEPADYIPKDIREKLKLGEFNDDNKPEKEAKKKTSETRPKVRGTDSKGRWVMVNGKKCYSMEEVDAQLKKQVVD
ncbi:MAG: hypothetical protein K6C41_06500 [Lachnospiraceae bacterium]|nr:hypothetical protein [Lachnospiraceae bacterium]